MKKNDTGLPKNSRMNISDYASIGRILVKFQLIEKGVNILCHCLLTLPKNHSEIILSEMAFKNKIQLMSVIGKDVLMNSISINQKEDLKQLELLIKKATECEDERNRIIHSEWFDGLKLGKQVIRVKTTAKIKKGLDKSVVTYTSRELNKIAKKFNMVFIDIVSFSEHLTIKLNRIHGSIISDDMSFIEPLKGIQDYYNKKYSAK